MQKVMYRILIIFSLDIPYRMETFARADITILTLSFCCSIIDTIVLKEQFDTLYHIYNHLLARVNAVCNT